MYGWEGTELVLIPIESPDYKKAKKYSDMLFNKRHFVGKDMAKGAIYNTKQDEKVIYLGRFDYFHNSVREKKKQRRYYFEYLGKRKKSDYSRYLFLSSLKDKIISIHDENCVDEYPYLIDDLEKKSFYSPVDYDLSEYKRIYIDNHDKGNTFVYHNYNMVPAHIHWSNGVSNRFIEAGLIKNEISEIRSICEMRNYCHSSYYWSSSKKGDNIKKLFNKFKVFKMTKKVLENGNECNDK